MFFDPLASASLPIETAWLSWEAQAVIAMRLAGMAGLWHAAPDEMTRMVTEKIDAGFEATEAATRTVFSGGTMDQAMRAVVREFSRHTADNVQRLSKLGPAQVF
ncbi:antibiotic ABC transporter [Thioclava sp. GXIMD4216]|uniref:Antibiotic ABC transporter n=1 Tax=Thioclava litoralis TaxID=3076557 RepID=A0ABZ1E1T5_9RHOB|nr:antibiotic ABC transporter [Thioclava sp. FTW29]